MHKLFNKHRTCLIICCFTRAARDELCRLYRRAISRHRAFDRQYGFEFIDMEVNEDF